MPTRTTVGFMVTAASGIAAVALLTANRIPARAQSPAASAPSQPASLNWGDQGDGTFRNPVLKSDYSDPDVIRAGNDFYLIASAFSFVGMQVLHSTDLVNWKVIGQIYPKLTMSPKYDQMRGYAEGTWAPAIRFHNGEFYVYVCTPHDGLFMWHAKNPAGPWSDTVTVKAVDGWEDPCPFWDDDGTAYLVHSHTGAGPLILHKMSADGTRLLDDGTEIYRGPTAEGPKMFKRHGYYYISHPEGGVDTGGQVVIRAKNIRGPYEARQVMANGQPHQGGMVELDSGEAWFIAFKSAGWLGRVDYLEPVVWGTDDWPTFGDNGKNVEQFKKPNVGMKTAPSRPDVDDEFDQPTMNPIWQWNHNPVNENWSLTERQGFLRLKALPADNLGNARNTLTQMLWDDFGVIDVKLSTAHLADEQRAGVAFECGNQFSWIGVQQMDGKRVVAAGADSPPRGRGIVSGAAPATATQPTRGATLPAPGFTGPEVSDVVYLRLTYEPAAAAGPGGLTAAGHAAFSLDGKTFTPVPGASTLRFLDWKGARVGLFSFGAIPGNADFDSFHYRYFSTNAALSAALGNQNGT